MKKKKIIAILTFSALIIFVTSYYIKDNRSNKLTKVEDYRIDTGCLAITASCGECFGKIINNQCYVNKNELTHKQLIQMGFN